MSSIHHRLEAWAAAGISDSLNRIRRGLEKESLRVSPAGTLAQTPHQHALGSALTHPEITTDFSEALLEFITPPSTDVAAVLEHLDRIHRFTYAQLDGELLWASSMPCILSSHGEIPVARYGSSNVATMKTVYRLGLGHRYGRSMQTIAGIHYNFSLADEFWPALHRFENSALDLQDFKTQRYFDLIRNFRRYFWLLLYLFGAAPAVCQTFVEGRQHSLLPLAGSPHSLHAPFGTSLRMGDLGYQSKAQQSLAVTYNTLPDYLRTLCGAIVQPHPDYERIGLKDAAGHYQQLNTGVLQIENEFYSTIRPKRTTLRGETALGALYNRGVEYVEVRCIDLNPYEPLGITAEQIHFLDTFLVLCLLAPSPQTDEAAAYRVQENQQRIVYRGRDPALTLLNGKGEPHTFGDWAGDLMQQLNAVADLLDDVQGHNEHRRAVERAGEKIADPGLTPAARVLEDMGRGLSYFDFAMDATRRHADYFLQRPLDADQLQAYRHMAARSLEEQVNVERADTLPFDAYLKRYYEQYRCCM